MGTVDTFHGIKIRVNPRDHDPPHVHVVGHGAEARFNIKTMMWMSNNRFSKSDLNAIQEVIERRIEEIWKEWRRCHEDE